jgi:hypothetical protein
MGGAKGICLKIYILAMKIGLKDAPGRADHETGVRKYQEPSTSEGNPNLRPWPGAHVARVRRARTAHRPTEHKYLPLGRWNF